MIKRFLASLFALVLILGALPMAAFADQVEISEHSYTIPTANASAPSDEPLITVGTISDPHTDYGLQNKDPYIRTSYITAMNALKAEGIDVLLVGGDITSDNEDGGGNLRWERSVYDRTVAQYQKYSAGASTTGKTLWACGNHDHEVGRLTNSITEGDYDSYEGFQNMMIQDCGEPIDLFTQQMDTSTTSDSLSKDHWLGAHYKINGFDFIIINPPYASATYYSTGTLKWLDETLSKIGAGKTVFITGHYPLYDSRNMTRNDDYGIKDTNYTNFMNVMKKYNNAIYLYGHNHGDGDSVYISADSYERITHYDKNGKVVSARMVPPASFITSFMGSASFYKYSLNPDWLGAPDPKIVQAMTITVYADRIEFSVINCGEKEGSLRDPYVYTVKRDVLGGGGSTETIEIEEIYTMPNDLPTASSTNWSKDNFALYYMDKVDGVLMNDWKKGTTYVNLKSDGHGRGTFDKRPGSAIRVFPEDQKSAVIQFTAPEDGIYKYEAPVISYATTGKGGNKQIVFSVMKNGIIYNITQPNYKENYSGIISGTIELKKGETLLFVADQYVRFFNDLTSSGDYKSGWIAGYYSDISIARLSGTPTGEDAVTYKYDGSGLNFTEGGYSVNSNNNYSVVAIDYSAKKLLSVERGTTGNLGAAVYKASAGDVTVAYRNSDNVTLYGPFGAGNSNKNVASAIAFTAPESGVYNLTALLLHGKDYDAATKKNSSIVYEILDSNMNVIFSGSTANSYTEGNVENTYSRAAAQIPLNKGESAYLVFKAASEATDLTSDAMATQIVSLSATMLSAGCNHSFGDDNVCDICGFKDPSIQTTPDTNDDSNNDKDKDNNTIVIVVIAVVAVAVIAAVVIVLVKKKK